MKLGLRPNTLVLNLNPERDNIKLNIQKRLLERWNNEKMLQEVGSLISSGVSRNWLKSLGLEYRFITEHIDGEFESEKEMLTKLSTEIWRFAKRQITFIKRWEYAKEVKTKKEALSLVKKFLKD
jgi:tRNA dimethylallyltransferase